MTTSTNRPAPRKPSARTTDPRPDTGPDNVLITVANGLVTITMRVDGNLGPSMSGKNDIAGRLDRFYHVAGTDIVIPAFNPYHDAKQHAK